MQYMLMCCFDEEAWEGLPDAEKGKLVITDGPFAETKEQLGGYHLVECKDLDEALAIALRIPTVSVGGAVEVRPLEMVFDV